MFNLSSFLSSFSSGVVGGISPEYVELLEGFMRVAEFAGELIDLTNDDDGAAVAVAVEDDDDDLTVEFSDEQFRQLLMLHHSQRDNELLMLYHAQRDNDMDLFDVQQEEYDIRDHDDYDIRDQDDMQCWDVGDDVVSPPVDADSEVILSCAACFEPYTAIFAVPCGHTFCYVCSLKCVNSERCYNCRSVFNANAEVQQIFLGQSAKL